LSCAGSGRKFRTTLERISLFIKFKTYLNYKLNAMTTTIKWVVLCIMFGLVSGWLYTVIDSSWSQENKASIWVTILFFFAAVATILCGFNAVDKNDHPVAGH
jgi:hypothetical protein